MGGAIAVLRGGPSGEREVSLLSGEAVRDALRGRGLEVIDVVIDGDLRWSFDGGPYLPLVHALPEVISRSDVVFSLLHGPFGEDGVSQGLLDACRVAYVGSGVTASAVGMHKGLTRRIATTLGIPVAPAVEEAVVKDAAAGRRLARRAAAAIHPPWFVKPAASGSSVGVTRVDEAAALEAAIDAARREGGGVLVEAAIAGREVSCPVLGGGDGAARALPIVEIVAAGHAFFDYQAKYHDPRTEERCPADLPADATATLQRQALAMHETLGCRGFSRCDFMIPAEGPPVFLEINTLPGMTPRSLVPRAAAEVGLDFAGLCVLLVDLARGLPVEVPGARP